MSIEKYDWKKKLTQSGGSLDGIKKIQGLTKVLDSMQKEINQNRMKARLETDANIDSAFMDRAKMITERLETAQEQMRNFASQGYGLDDQSSSLMRGLETAIATTDKFLGSAREGAVAMQRLAESTPTQQFRGLADALGESTGELAANAATLAKLGLGYSSFAKNIDIMTYSLNQPVDTVKNFNQELFNFAKSVNQLPSLVSSNFQMVASSLAYSFPKIQSEFMKIQEMSAKTGLSVSKLMGTFGQQTDTISGASSFAAGLNTIIGKNVFSATQILMMNESERMTATRNALKDSQIYKDYMSGDEKLKKFALRAISGRLQMTTDETRRFLDGDAGDDTMKGRMAAGVEGKFGNLDEKGRKFAGVLEDLSEEIKKNVELISTRRLTAIEREALRRRQNQADALLALPGTNKLSPQMQQQFRTQFQQRFRFDGSDQQQTAAYVDTMLEAMQGNMKDKAGNQIDSRDLFRLMDRVALLRLAEPMLDTPFETAFAAFQKDRDVGKFRSALKDLEAQATTIQRKDDDRITVQEEELLRLESAPTDPADRARMVRELKGENITFKGNPEQQKAARDKFIQRIKGSNTGASLPSTTAGGSLADVEVIPGSTVDQITQVVLNFEGITIQGLAKMVAQNLK